MGGPVNVRPFGPSSQLMRTTKANRISTVPIIRLGMVPVELIVFLNRELVEKQPFGLAPTVIELLNDLQRKFGLQKAGTLWPVKLNLLEAGRGPSPLLPNRTKMEQTIRNLQEVVERFPAASGAELPVRVQIEARRRLRLRFPADININSVKRRIAKVEGIQYVEVVRQARIPSPPVTVEPPEISIDDPSAKIPDITADWAMRAIGKPKTVVKGLENIAILDSGIDISHPAFKDVKDFKDGNVWFTDSESTVDPCGHGTFVAGIILGKKAVVNSKLNLSVNSTSDTINGMLPTSKAWICTVIDPVGVNLGANKIEYFVDPGWYSWALNQIADAHEFNNNPRLQKIQVVNLSLGSEVYSPTEAMDIERLVGQNVTIVVAAGNTTDGTIDLLYPAALPGVIAVGAYQYQNKELWIGSRYGGPVREIDLTAPGQGIFSTIPIAPSSMGIQFSGWSTGTSFAAPFVTAVAAAFVSVNGMMSSQDLVGKISDDGDPDHWPTLVWK